MRIYTRLGDEGDTGLLYGGRVSKASLRTEAYGCVDEAVSSLGLARSMVRDPLVASQILWLQRTLFTLGAELATVPSQYGRFLQHFSAMVPETTLEVETTIDALSKQVEIPRSFIIPGASAGSAALDVARSVLRRAERRVVEMDRRKMLANPELLRFLNRASDLLFILARYEDRHLPAELLTREERPPS